MEETQGNSSGFLTSTRVATTNCQGKAAPPRDTPTMTIGRGIMATLARRDGMSPCPELYPGGLRGLQARRGRGALAWQPTTTQCLRASRGCTRARCRAAPTVLGMARLLRRPPITRPLVPRMHLALNPLGPKLLPGAGTWGPDLKDPILLIWAARAILLRRRMQTAEHPPSRPLPRLPCLPLSTPG